jgi:hypothetical protein
VQILEDKKDDAAVGRRLEVINLTENLRVRVDNFCQACEDDAFKAAGEKRRNMDGLLLFLIVCFCSWIQGRGKGFRD